MTLYITGDITNYTYAATQTAQYHMPRLDTSQYATIDYLTFRDTSCMQVCHMVAIPRHLHAAIRRIRRSPSFPHVLPDFLTIQCSQCSKCSLLVYTNIIHQHYIVRIDFKLQEINFGSLTVLIENQGGPNQAYL